MKSKFILEKEVSKAKFVLEKKKVKSIKAHIVVALDVSGSTSEMYKNGTFQEAFQKVLPIGILFDDNGEIDTYVFCNQDKNQKIDVNANQENYADYINENILNNSDLQLWGGTDYSPVIEKIATDFGLKNKVLSRFFGGKKYSEKTNSGHPVIVYFFTDGENQDHVDTLKTLNELQSANSNIYIQFIGIGRQSFPAIEKYASDYPNVGFLHVRDLYSDASSDDFTEKLLNEELCSYLREKA